MPDYITNKLSIIGTDEQIKEVLDFIKVEKKKPDQKVYGIGTIDFNKITPMPKWVYNKNLGKSDEEKYGKENCWYYWCRENWGTKWNAVEQQDKRNTDKTIYFKTAWNGVPALIQKLAWIFPEVTIEYGYADEAFRYNVAKYEFRDTEILENLIPDGGSKEAIELAFEITQSTAQDHGLVFNADTNTYEYTED